MPADAVCVQPLLERGLDDRVGHGEGDVPQRRALALYAEGQAPALPVEAGSVDDAAVHLTTRAVVPRIARGRDAVRPRVAREQTGQRRADRGCPEEAINGGQRPLLARGAPP